MLYTTNVFSIFQFSKEPAMLFQQFFVTKATWLENEEEIELRN